MTRKAWNDMTDNWRQHNEVTPMETESGLKTQTMADKSVWETVPTVMETGLQRAAATTVTTIRTMVTNKEDHARIMAEVHRCCEDNATTLEMTAGTVLSIAATLHVSLNKESIIIEGNPAQCTAETVRQRRIQNSTQINQQKLIEQSSQLEESWEQAYERCRTAIQMCETNKCPAWLSEKHTTAKTLKKRARELIQKTEGTVLRGTEQPVRVVHQEEVVMAAARLSIAALQHHEQQEVEK